MGYIIGPEVPELNCVGHRGMHGSIQISRNKLETMKGETVLGTGISIDISTLGGPDAEVLWVAI